MKKFEKVTKEIKEMKIQGAISIAIAAVEALEDLIKNSKAKGKREFLAEIESAAEKLIKTRPTAVSLPNAVNEYISEVRGLNGDIEGIKAAAYAIGKSFVLKNLVALQKIAESGAKLVKNNSTVLIHCHSSTVIGILKQAKKEGKRFKVICTETRPWHQGFISAKQLSEAGIETELIVDSAAMQVMNEVDLVLTGADAVTSDKKLINKIGTAGIALIAKSHKVPMYAAAQKLKFTDKKSSQIVLEERDVNEILEGEKMPKVNARNVVFDVTPLKELSGIITEDGIKKY